MNRLTAGSPLRTRVQIQLWRHGWAWPAALLLLAASAALQWAVLKPLRGTLATTQAELVHEQSTAGTGRAPEDPASEAQELAALETVLRASPEPAETVRQMATLAQAEQIYLQQGDYQQHLHSATRLVEVHVTQPVRAGYPQLRRYVEAVLRANPNVSLDQLVARRESVGQVQLDVRLRWSFWIRKELPGQPNIAARHAK